MLLISLDGVWTQELKHVVHGGIHTEGIKSVGSFVTTKGEFPGFDHFRSNMTDTQFKVAFEGGTEPSFQNAYFDNHEPGIYKSIATGVPLFSSKDKFDSGTGWPSFGKTLPGAPVIERKDTSYGMTRTEVIC